MAERPEVPASIVASLREICLALPEAYEEEAWVGTRWCVRKKNFAHVVAIADGWPPAYARAAGSDGPLTVLTFRAPADEVEAFRHLGAPFFVPVWFDDIVGMALHDDVDWTQIAELVTDSYCVLAPKRLRDQLTAPKNPNW
jgi:hypothetical protein